MLIRIFKLNFTVAWNISESWFPIQSPVWSLYCEGKRKYLHMKMCGEAFPHSDKVVRIKKKNPIPHWDELPKAFCKKKIKTERLVLISIILESLKWDQSSLQGLADHRRAHRHTGLTDLALPFSGCPLYRRRLIEYSQLTWEIQVQTYLNQRLELEPWSAMP